MTTDWPATYGLVLAGGLSRRMGGGDKPLIEIDGRTILARVLTTLAGQCVGLVINANGDPTRFSRYGRPVVGDDVPGFVGPLAGIGRWPAPSRARFATPSPHSGRSRADRGCERP
jgi:molybdenum cofactor guanylyltransferase